MMLCGPQKNNSLPTSSSTLAKINDTIAHNSITCSTMSVLSSLPAIDTLRRENALNVTREDNNNLDVLEVIDVIDDEDEGGENDTPPSSERERRQPLGLCHLSAVLPFTQGDGEPGLSAFEAAASVALAAHHLNTGDGSIIPQIDGLNHRCNIRFSVEFADTAYSASQALDVVTNQMQRGPNDGRPRPCAFIGAFRSSISMPMSILTGLRGYVQVSSSSTSESLEDRDQFPLFGRTVPSDYGTAILIIRYYQEVLGANHLAIINVNDAYGNRFAQGLRLAAQSLAPQMQLFQIPLDSGSVSVKDAIDRVKETQFRYIFGVVFTRDVHDQLMTEAHAHGVAGTGLHNWLFADSFSDVALDQRALEKDSPLAVTYRGVGMVVVSGGLPVSEHDHVFHPQFCIGLYSLKIFSCSQGMPRYDLYNSKMEELKNKEDQDYLASIIPKNDGETPFVYDDNFLLPIRDPIAPFTYEAAALLGLSACVSANDTLSLTGRNHYDSMLTTNMRGVLDDVVLSETGSRTANSTFFTIVNFVDEPTESANSVMFKAVHTHGFENGDWQQYQDYIFNDGSSRIQPDLPDQELDLNYISPVMRGVVLSLCAIAVLLAFWLTFWTYRHLKTRVVRASQPFFLYLICVGSVIASSAIIPNSFDHAIASIEGMNIACNSIIWLVCLGFGTIFSALFSKTYRINQIMRSARRFQRIKIQRRDAVKPMIVVLSANILVLALMSAIDPIQFNIHLKAEDIYGRPSETLGQCVFEDQKWYLLVLLIINVGIIFLAGMQAWQARNISTEYAESKHIFRALMITLLILFIGLPVLVIAYDNPNSNVFISRYVKKRACAHACASILPGLFSTKFFFHIFQP